MKLRKLFKSKLFIKYLRYYMLMFIIPLLLLGVINYIYSTNEIDRRNDRYYNSLLVNVKNSIEDQLKYFNEWSVFILNDKRFKNILTQEGWEHNRIDVFEMVNELKTITYSNRHIEEVALYIPVKQAIINVSGIQDADMYFQKVYGLSGQEPSVHSLENLLGDPPIWRHFYYSRPTSVFVKNQMINAMTFVKTTSSPITEEGAAITFIMNSAWVEDILPSSWSDNSAYIFVQDNSEQMIMGNPAHSLDQLLKKGYVLFTEQVNGVPWEISIVVKHTDTSFARDYIRSFLTAIVILLLIGFILASVLSMRSYRPVQKVIALIEQEATGGERMHVTAKDEYTRIGHYLEDSNAAIKQISEKMALYKQRSAENSLYRIVTGIHNEEDIRLLSAMDPSAFSFAVYFTVVYTAVCPFHSNEISPTSNRFVTEAFGERVKEDFTSNDISLHVLRKNKNTMLFLFGLSSNELVNALLLKLQSYKGNFETETNALLYMGAGIVVNAVGDIALSHKHASHSLDHARVKGIRDIAAYRFDDADHQVGCTFPLEAKLELIHAIQAMDGDRTEELIRHIVADHLNNTPHLSLLGAQCLYYEICASLMKGLQANAPDYTINLEELEQSYSLRDLPAWAVKLMKEASVSTGSAEGDLLSQHVISLIEEHYCNPSLTLQYIAEQLNVPVESISENVSFDIQDYVNRKRMSYAKKLLMESDETVKHISLMCGFTNENVFIRVFKRYEATTPGQYRRVYR